MKITLGMTTHKALLGVFTSLSLIVAGTAWSLTPAEQQIAERIKPVGKVCIEGQECEGAVKAGTTAVAVTSGPRSGSEIYTSKCFACHDTGAAGAPKVGEAGDWEGRMGKGVDTLIANAINGIGGMPPKGTCGDCSDEEIANTVQHMIDNSQ